MSLGRVSSLSLTSIRKLVDTALPSDKCCVGHSPSGAVATGVPRNRASSIVLSDPLVKGFRHQFTDSYQYHVGMVITCDELQILPITCGWT